MLTKIRSLHVTKENGYYNLKAILEDGNNGFITLNSKINPPSLQISTAQNDYIKHNTSFFHSIVLNKSASFHFNADAIVDYKNNNSLFTLEMDKKEKSHIPQKMGKKEKSYIPKKHRKYSKRKTTSK